MFVEICHQTKIFYEFIPFPTSAVVFYQRKAIPLTLWKLVRHYPFLSSANRKNSQAGSFGLIRFPSPIRQFLLKKGPFFLQK